MACDKIWLIAEDGRPLALTKGEDGVFREPVSVKMVFISRRYSLDLSLLERIEVIAPYHFKGKPLLLHLLGVAIGIAAAGLINIEPIVSAIVVATFAISTLIFQGGTPSEYKIIRTKGPDGFRCIVVADEDIAELSRRYPDAFCAMEAPEPSYLTEQEKKQVEVQRYGFVTTLSALTLIALAGPMARVFAGQETWISSAFIPIVFVTSLALAYVGVARVFMALLRKKNANTEA